MDRLELIIEFKRLVATGEVTDIESFCQTSQHSRTKARKLLEGDEYTPVHIRKRTIYIKK